MSERPKIKVVKYHFITLWRFGVFEEKPGGGAESAPPPGIDTVQLMNFVASIGNKYFHTEYPTNDHS